MIGSNKWDTKIEMSMSDFSEAANLFSMRVLS
jgi:hypothetical protein